MLRSAYGDLLAIHRKDSYLGDWILANKATFCLAQVGHSSHTALGLHLHLMLHDLTGLPAPY